VKRRRLKSGRANILLPVVLAILIVALTSGTTYAGSYKYEETVRKTVPLKGETVIVINSKGDDITVIGEEGAKEIFLEAIKTVKAEDREVAERLAQMIEIEIERDGDELKINVKYPKQHEVKRNILSYLFQRHPRMGMNIHLTIPSELDVNANTASGDVTVSDILGSTQISAASGDIKATNIGGFLRIGVASGEIDAAKVNGEARLASASGDISARNVAGDAAVSTASGDIKLSEIDGNLDIQTASGDATVDGVGTVSFKGTSGSAQFIDVRGGVEAASASGDLSFRLIPMEDFDYKIGTSSGDITLRFLKPMAGGFVLKASTTTGEISVNLPIKVSKVGRNTVSGIVRDGKSKVLLETASGDITISEPEE